MTARQYDGINTPLKENEYESCLCGEEVSHCAPDGIAICDSCGIVEGSTIIGTYED